MTYNISFLERAKLSTAIISKQPAVSLKEAKEQAQWLKTNSSIKKKNQRLVQIAEINL
jgi:hypothetical protein